MWFATLFGTALIGWLLLSVFFWINSLIWEVVHEEFYSNGAVFIVWRNRLTGRLSQYDTR